jgi:hypothetical protein
VAPGIWWTLRRCALESEVFGAVASDTTARRALDETGGRARTAIGRVRAAARAQVWQLLPEGPPDATFAGGMAQPGMVVLRVDGLLVVAHSKKERAAPTFKKTYGHHPLGCWIDNTGELASPLLRAGNAGSNTAADLIAVLHEAIGQVPKPYRRRLLITSDGAGASHPLIDWAHRQNHAADRSVQYSVGFDVDADVRAAIGRLPAGRWQPGLDNTTGAVRADIDAAEITDLLGERLTRTGWPKSMRVIVRRTRLAPGEQPTLFHLDGYTYSAFVTNTGPGLSIQLLDARHRAHARGGRRRAYQQGHRPGPPAVEVLDGQPRLVPRHHHRHRPARLAQAARLPRCRHPRQGRTSHPALPAAARPRPARASRPHPPAPRAGHLALGQRTHPGFRPRQDPAGPQPWPTHTNLPRRPGGPRRPRRRRDSRPPAIPRRHQTSSTSDDRRQISRPDQDREESGSAQPSSPP